MSSLVERLERRHRPRADEDRLTDLGRRRLHQRRRLAPAADRRTGARRHVAGGAVQPVQLATGSEITGGRIDVRGSPARHRMRLRNRRGRRSAPPSSGPVPAVPAGSVPPAASVPVRSTKSTAAASLVGERRTPVGDALSIGAVTGRALGARTGVRRASRRAAAPAAAARPARAARPAVASGEGEQRVPTAAAGGRTNRYRTVPPGPYCSTQIVVNTNTQMMSTRCQKSDTPSAQLASASWSAPAPSERTAAPARRARR